MLFSLLGNAIGHGSSNSPIVVQAAPKKNIFEIGVANSGQWHAGGLLISE
jgi:hypothetical protein